MRFFPQSRRGTWLLAGAVWLAACAGLWWALPVMPRGFLQLPVDAEWACLGPSGDTGVVGRCVRVSASEPEGNSRECSVQLVKIPSGELITTLVDGGPVIDLVGASTDRHTLLLYRVREPESQLVCVDMLSGTAKPLALRNVNWLSTRLSPDGRFVSNVFGDEESTVEVWDVQANRLFRTLRGFIDVEFSPDSRLLVAKPSFSPRNRVQIVDLATLSIRATFIGSPDAEARSATMSDTGQHVVAEFEWGKNGDEVICWNAATGAVEHDIYNPTDQVGSPTPSRAIITYEWTNYNALPRCTDWHNPFLVPFDSTASFVEPHGDVQVSPDGRTLLAAVDRDSAGWLQALAARFGITTWFADSDRLEGQLFNLNTGRPIGVLPIQRRLLGNFVKAIGVHWSGDGQTLAVYDPRSEKGFFVWDIPPRKPLTWFAAGAALLALPIGLAAWWRVRRLRAA